MGGSILEKKYQYIRDECNCGKISTRSSHRPIALCLNSFRSWKKLARESPEGVLSRVCTCSRRKSAEVVRPIWVCHADFLHGREGRKRRAMDARMRKSRRCQILQARFRGVYVVQYPPALDITTSEIHPRGGCCLGCHDVPYLLDWTAAVPTFETSRNNQLAIVYAVSTRRHPAHLRVRANFLSQRDSSSRHKTALHSSKVNR